MKSGREHRTPLSDRVLELIAELPHDGDYLFPGSRPGACLSNMALLKVLERMDRADLTTHGFRSTFRDWTAERTNYPRDIAEAALAHAVADKTEGAYRRGDAVDKRRRLMTEWARDCPCLPEKATWWRSMPKTTISDEQLAESEQRLRDGDKDRAHGRTGLLYLPWDLHSDLGEASSFTRPTARCMMAARLAGTMCLASLGREGILPTCGFEKSWPCQFLKASRSCATNDLSMRRCSSKWPRKSARARG